jgi:hypothetical protein
MASRPASIRSGGFIAAVYTATNLLIPDRNSAGPSSLNVTVCLISASLLPSPHVYAALPAVIRKSKRVNDK